MGYAISTIVRCGFDETLARTRSALAEQGFGVLTEIDLAATLKKKLDADIPAQVILGACNPPSGTRFPLCRTHDDERCGEWACEHADGVDERGCRRG